MNRWLNCIQIWYDCFLGISDYLINFWDESIKNKMAVAPFNPLNPHDALKHRFASLKNDLIS